MAHSPTWAALRPGQTSVGLLTRASSHKPQTLGSRFHSEEGTSVYDAPYLTMLSCQSISKGPVTNKSFSSYRCGQERVWQAVESFSGVFRTGVPESKHAILLAGCFRAAASYHLIGYLGARSRDCRRGPGTAGNRPSEQTACRANGEVDRGSLSANHVTNIPIQLEEFYAVLRTLVTVPAPGRCRKSRTVRHER